MAGDGGSVRAGGAGSGNFCDMGIRDGAKIREA